MLYIGPEKKSFVERMKVSLPDNIPVDTSSWSLYIRIIKNKNGIPDVNRVFPILSRERNISLVET